MLSHLCKLRSFSWTRLSNNYNDVVVSDDTQ